MAFFFGNLLGLIKIYIVLVFVEKCLIQKGTSEKEEKHVFIAKNVLS